MNLTDADTHGALYACAYDYAAHDVSPWCDVFDEEELGHFEYDFPAWGVNLLIID